jgi:hypothetical protein
MSRSSQTTPRRPRDVLYSCRFGQDTVTVQQIPGRLIVRLPRGWPSHPDADDGHPFTRAVIELQETVGWGSNDRRSLMGALWGDYEPAHILVGMNLPSMEKFARGEVAVFCGWQVAIWKAMRLGYQAGLRAGQRQEAA